VNIAFALLVGTRIHHYSFANGGGWRVTWLSELPVVTSFSFSKVSAGVRLFFGLAGAPPEHRLWGREAWQRSGTSLGSSLTLGFGP
jgi:hypothetical protein